MGILAMMLGLRALCNSAKVSMSKTEDFDAETGQRSNPQQNPDVNDNYPPPASSPVKSEPDRNGEGDRDQTSIGCTENSELRTVDTNASEKSSAPVPRGKRKQGKKNPAATTTDSETWRQKQNEVRIEEESAESMDIEGKELKGTRDECQKGLTVDSDVLSSANPAEISIRQGTKAFSSSRDASESGQGQGQGQGHYKESDEFIDAWNHTRSSGDSHMEDRMEGTDEIETSPMSRRSRREPKVPGKLLPLLECLRAITSHKFGSLFKHKLESQSAEYIDFSNNELSGPLPSMWPIVSGLIYSLQHLNLSSNQLNGSLAYNGAIPFENLKVLDISNNRFSGQLPSFNFIYSLEILRLSNNEVSGPLPGALFMEGSLVLSELDLSHNNLSGNVNNIATTNLKVLNLSSNALSGTLPIKFGICAVVDLSDNNLSGDLSMMRTWGNYMEVLDLSQNSFTGSLPNDTSQFLRLTYLNLSHNNLVGSLPTVLGMYPKINVIDLSFNKLNGALLTSLFTLSTMEHLHLSSNNFTGGIPLPDILPVNPASSVIPIQVTKYSFLESLDLSNNHLSGTIPPQVGAIDRLKTLNLGGNQLSGNIPNEISKLFVLVNLDLSHNQLSGKIPGNLPASLKAFNVSYNDLSGYVPQNLRDFPHSSFYPGNSGLIFPRVRVSSNNGPGTSERHGRGLAKAVIIGICTAAAALFVGLALFLYYRRISNFDDKIVSRDIDRGKTSGAGYFGFGKDVEPSRPVRVSAEHLLAPERTTPVVQPTLLTIDSTVMEVPDLKAKDLDSSKSSTVDISSSMNKRRSSPGSNSFFSSSPQSEDSFAPDHPVILNVRSPDRLAGDLFFLDETLSFTAEELSRAPAEVLGRSSHGTSYKATLDNGHVLTVKWLREGLAKHKREFAREAKKFGNIRHPNLVSLRGYYWGPREHEKLILSDYVSTESLANHLYVIGTEDVFATPFTCDRTGLGDAIIAGIIRKLTSQPKLYDDQVLLEKQLSFAICGGIIAQWTIGAVCDSQLKAQHGI